MEMIFRSNKMIALVQKYKYLILILLIGVILMMIPVNHKEYAKEISVTTETKYDITQELENILSQIEGAGEVKVMLTIKSSEETVYQSDRDIDQSNQSSSEHRETVVISDSDRNESGLVKQIHSPVYMGAIILSQGANDPAIRLQIAEAVSKITGLGVDKIAILKMK